MADAYQGVAQPEGGDELSARGEEAGDVDRHEVGKVTASEPDVNL